MPFKHTLSPVFSNYGTLILKFTECYKLEEGCGKRSFFPHNSELLNSFVGINTMSPGEM